VHFFSPTVRLQASAVWSALTFVMNGIVFVLIGLQLPSVLGGIDGMGIGRMIAAGAALSLLVILLRIVWVFPAARLSFFLRQKLLRQDVTRPPPRQLFVIGWSGMRGVISLAAAVSLTQTVGGRNGFPQRNAIVFLTFCVILATLVVQGLLLPPLIRALGLEQPAGPDCEAREARRIVLQSALARLEPMRAADRPEAAPLYDDLQQHYQRRLANVSGDQGEDGAGSGQRRRYVDVALELLRAERAAAIRLSEQRRIDEELLRDIEHELDLREARLQRGAE
jgi:CPA1 family monovalent cation:H+ antiporter